MHFFYNSFRIDLLATLIVTLSAVPFSTSQNAGQYPLCPRTGLLPLLTTQPFTRCLQANAHTCCSNCFDLQLGLEELCALFVGHHDCQFALEQFACAINCDPDGGSFIFGSEFQVCNSTAGSVYQTCSGLTVPGLQVSNLAALFSSPNEYLARLFQGFSAGIAAPPLNFTVVPDAANCYKLPSVLPRQPVCCDPLNVSATCAPYVNLDSTYPSLLPFVDRQVDAQDCVLRPLAPSPIASPSPPPQEVQLGAPPPPPSSISSGGLSNNSVLPYALPISKPSSGHLAKPGSLLVALASLCFALL